MTSITAGELALPGCFPLPERRGWRIGIIGFGGVAGPHVEAYLAAGWSVVAVADPDPAAVERARARVPDAAFYSSFEELIDDPRVEVVSLLTHPMLREGAVARAVEAGKPILSEKPLALDMDAAARMVEKAGNAGVPFAVSQNYRWDGVNYLVHHLVRDGWIGNPYLALIEIEGDQDVGVAPHPYYPHVDDFLTIQWNTHLADLLRYWLGKSARRVMAVTRRMAGQNFRSDNLLVSIADFGDGVTGHILHNELLRSGMLERRCRVEGDLGSIVFPLNGTSLGIESKRLGPGVRTLVLPPESRRSSFAGPMSEFLIAIEEGREASISARRNLDTLRHVFAETRSARAGGRWEEVGRPDG